MLLSLSPHHTFPPLARIELPVMVRPTVTHAIMRLFGDDDGLSVIIFWILQGGSHPLPQIFIFNPLPPNSLLEPGLVDTIGGNTFDTGGTCPAS